MRVWPRNAFVGSGFRKQLVTIFTVGVVLLAILSSVAVSALSSRSVNFTLVKQGSQAAEAFASQSALALLYESPENATEAVKTTLAFPDIVGVAIYDLEQSELLAEGDAALLREPVVQWPSSTGLVRESDDEWEFMAPVYSQPLGSQDEDSPFRSSAPDPQLLGYVRVVMGKETLHVLGGDILRGNFIVLLSLAGVLLLLLLAITARLTNPLKQLSEFMQRAESGEKGVRAAIRGPKEIQDMESVFNNMMDVLEAREEELKTARDLALESARIKGEFAANVSHELRTPLNSVLGMLELLNGMGLSTKQHEYVDVARNSGESLLSLIDEILDFSKIEASKLKIEPVDFRLQETVDDVVALLAGQAHRKGLEIGHLVRSEVPSVVVGDPTRIRQVLINLIGNAIKFTETGEVSVEAGLEAVDEDTVRIRFEVRDTGIGIAPGADERIFEAFSQADGSTTRKYGGTGLGLAISSQLVHLMGGEIGVVSQPAHGSTFWFSIPLKRSCTAPRAAQVVWDPLQGRRILIADRRKLSRTYLEQMVSRWAAEYQSVTDGPALSETLRGAAVEGRAFQLLIVDENVIVGSPAALLSEMAEFLGELKVLLLSGQRFSIDPEALPRGVHCMGKPIRESVVYRHVVELVHQSADPPRQPADRPVQAEAPEPSAWLGAHVLVVEDNRANQQVAIGMLERLGCTADVVANGVDALNAIAGRRYDLVLMDCQMPQMDGYEATRRLRSFEAGGRRLPVIAMTANVQRGDAEKCQDAGMDHYLPKPLQLGALRATLEGALGDHTVDAVVAVGESPCAYPTETPVSAATLRELRDSLGEAYVPMLECFLADAPDYLDAIETAVSEADTDRLAAVAHSLKGSARNFGADVLGEMCRRLEDCGRRGNIEAASPELSAVREAYHRVRAQLQAELAAHKAKAGHHESGSAP